MDPNVQQPSPSQPVQPQVPQTTPTSLPKILLIVLSIVIVLGLIGGAYYLGTQKNADMVSNEKTVAAVPTKTEISAPTITATPTSDVTVNWKVYTDSYNSIVIKYPTDWSYDTALLAKLKTVAFGPGSYKIPLQTEARSPISLTIKGEQYNAVVKRNTDYYDGNQVQQPISFGGLSGTFISGTSTQPGPGQGFSGGAYVLDKNGTAIEFSYSVINGVDYKNVASQMIQTLQVK